MVNHFTLCLGLGAAAFVMIAAVWWYFARTLLPIQSLLGIPSYVIRKVNIYNRFVTHRQKEWVRTDRGE